MRVPPSLSQHWHCLYTDMLLLQTLVKALVGMLLVFPTLILSRPWHSQLQSHLSEPAIILPILLLLTLSSQTKPFLMKYAFTEASPV